VRRGLRARGHLVRRLPPRREPFYARQLPQIRSYPAGYEIGRLGTFPPRCPVPDAGGPVQGPDASVRAVGGTGSFT
jgi:hypothetical protein